MRCASWKCAGVFKRPLQKKISGSTAGPGTDRRGAAAENKQPCRNGMYHCGSCVFVLCWTILLQKINGNNYDKRYF